MFSPVATGHWLRGLAIDEPDGDVVVTVDATLAADRSASLLDVRDGPTVLALTPDRAGDLGLADGERTDEVSLHGPLRSRGMVLGDPDHVFLLPVAQHAGLRDAAVASGVRRLTGRDEAALARLTAEAPEEEADEAFVELDHRLVVGAFVGDGLAAAASAYPWGGSALADIGVITLPGFRGRGVGRAAVRALSAAALREGREPQYRCRTDNTASIALARSAGLAHLGDWRLITPGR